MRTTIDFGIDLGTTNSCIAMIDGIGARVLKDTRQSETTLSFVWIKDEGQAIVVGRPARDTIKKSDGLDVFSKFKKKMGEMEEYRAKNSGRVFTPPQLSAEVLKELKKIIRERTQEDIAAAVITVPARFGAAQTSATHEAAKLAGFDRIEIIQEPAAAALAYGFQHNTGKSFHLVYDMGAGTFDAALLRVNDGLIEIINQGGDNYLGGTNLDEEIAEKIVIPYIQEEYGIEDFSRGNPKYKSDYEKLLLAIEDAKIELSSSTTALVSVDRLFRSSPCGPVFLDYELSRSQIEPLIEPFVRRSINISEKVIREANLAPGDIDSILLVGGPTHTPILRALLAEMGISINYDLDPMTVVAQGAAIFASTQILKKSPKAAVGAEVFRLEPEYQTTGMDEEVIMGGKIIPPIETSVEGLSIEFTEQKNKWRSGAIAIRNNGAFMTTLIAEKGRRNEFKVELTDGRGRALKVEPDVLPYTVGATINKTILTNSIGIGLQNGEMIQIIKKGDSLPARGTSNQLYSTKMIRQGNSQDVFIIPLYEGESPKVSSNQSIGEISFDGRHIKRNLPENQKVEVTIIIDTSERLEARAYVPVLDEEFPATIDLKTRMEKPAVVVAQAEDALAKLDEIRSQAEEYGNEDVLSRIHTLERGENLVDRLNRATEAAQRGSSEAVSEASNLTRTVKNAVEEMESIMELPKLEEEAAEELEQTEELVDENGNGTERRTFRRLKQEIDEALSKKNAKIAREKLDELSKLKYGILTRQPYFWVGYLQYLSEPECRNKMKDQGQASRLFQQGNSAIEQKNIDQIRSVVFQLLDLLPTEEKVKASSYQSTVRA